MKKLWILIITSSLFLSGCINITEELFLEKDGSGKYVTTINMEKLQEMMEMMKTYAPDSLQEADLGSVMQDSIQTMINDLSKVPGISEVKNENPDKNTVIVSFRFKDVSALNAALKKRSGKTTNGEYFSYSKGSFSCNDQSISGMGDMMSELNNSTDSLASGDMPKMDAEEMKAMMKMLDWSMKMKTVYHFPTKVSGFSNKMAKLSEDGKTVTLEIDLLDDNKEKSLENRIQFK
ncbi:MAG TPA: hypothetical protein VK166_17600 [Chitinophagaceae bacterium]|nr:hypothetical protein [Chitinophagaceae bacterium]